MANGQRSTAWDSISYIFLNFIFCNILRHFFTVREMKAASIISNPFQRRIRKQTFQACSKNFWYFTSIWTNWPLALFLSLSFKRQALHQCGLEKTSIFIINRFFRLQTNVIYGYDFYGYPIAFHYDWSVFTADIAKQGKISGSRIKFCSIFVRFFCKLSTC